TAGFTRRALVGQKKKILLGRSPAIRPRGFIIHQFGTLGSASRVYDERSDTNRRTALDPAPSAQKPSVSLDNVDVVIDALSATSNSTWEKPK
ncbi:MAG: hypothetical protein WBC04_23120, partial [Candidatus Acidiferrales bacterium]